MKAGFLFLFILILIASCKKKDAVPSGVLSQTKMKAVLWDMVRADVFLNDYWMRKDSALDRKIETSKVYQQVFRLNGVSREEFQRSFEFYRNHPAILKPMLDSITRHVNDPVTERVKENLRNDSARKNIKPVPFGDTSAIQKLKHKAVPPPKK